jgi:glutamate/tyrosine decarboxylase-like PLP-dependent enzyme
MRALKVWMLLKHLGLHGYRELIGHDIARARQLATAVDAAPGLELLGHGLSIVCFRARPVDWAGTGAELDQHNRDLVTALQLGGRGRHRHAGGRGGPGLDGEDPSTVDAQHRPCRFEDTVYYTGYDCTG